MEYKLRFSDSETALQAKNIIKMKSQMNIMKRGSDLIFKLQSSKNNAKQILINLGMRGLDNQ